jgi:uncharacterized protein YbaR (Trm112 family)
VNSRLRGLLACPACYGELAWTESQATCRRCKRPYAIDRGIPVLLDELPAGSLKAAQADYFDDIDEEFEIDRPRGTPRLYSWLLRRKFLYGAQSFASEVSGSTALVACGGSGMDAEFLARLGAEVVTSDISIGAALRAAHRFRRAGVDGLSLVGDVERLPFPDRSVDYVYVHDGLHHIENPSRGLAELARVARVGVSINEPADAFITRCAIRVGLAADREEAGNEVIRLDPRRVIAELQRAGFELAGSRRYLMFYRHHPRLMMRWFSVWPAYPIARAVVIALQPLAGRAGNKFTVQAIRTPAKDST